MTEFCLVGINHALAALHHGEAEKPEAERLWNAFKAYNANCKGDKLLPIEGDVMTAGALRMDVARHEVFLEDKPVFLTPKEFSLLRYLFCNRGRVLQHKKILNDVWGVAHVDDRQYLRIYIAQLRQKIEPPGTPHRFIFTEAGIGYRFEQGR